MTENFEPYGHNAVFTMHEAGGTEPQVLCNDMRIDPLYLYNTTNSVSDREYITLSGDLFHEVRAEGVYDEGIQWAELRVVRFGFKTSHPELGQIVISNDASRSATRASLCSIFPDAKFPAVHRSRIHVTATASNLQGAVLQNQGVPLFLESDALNAWPPTEAIYRFKFQVPFERCDEPGKVIVMLNSGAMRMRQAV